MALLVGFVSSSNAQVGGVPPAAGSPQAQQSPPRTAAATAGGQGVQGLAVVDVAYVFKNYGKFEQQMKLMKAKVEAAEAEVRKEQESMRAMAEQAKTFPPNSPEFKRAEETLLRKQGDLQLKIAMQKKQFMEEEGRVYFTVSAEIDDAVKSLAQKFNLVLVLRFSGDAPDPNDRNDILKNINKPIVYNHPQMDITPFVLQELSRAGGLSSNPQPNNFAPPRR
jgi:Skp family chaperone for outer membrane proteins